MVVWELCFLKKTNELPYHASNKKIFIVSEMQKPGALLSRFLWAPLGSAYCVNSGSARHKSAGHLVSIISSG